MRLSIIPYKTVIPTKHQPEYQAYDSSSIVDVQDWLIALFGVLEVSSLAKSRKFSNFCFYISKSSHMNRIFLGVKKTYHVFFVFLSFLH